MLKHQIFFFKLIIKYIFVRTIKMSLFYSVRFEVRFFKSDIINLSDVCVNIVVLNAMKTEIQIVYK